MTTEPLPRGCTYGDRWLTQVATASASDAGCGRAVGGGARRYGQPTIANGPTGDALQLLTLTAGLHAATRQPSRWPEAWAALCQWADCAEVFGPVGPAGLHVPSARDPDAPAADLPPPQNLGVRMATVRTAAKLCAHAGSGRCGQGIARDNAKRLACMAVVEHLDLALGQSPSAPT